MAAFESSHVQYLCFNHVIYVQPLEIQNTVSTVSVSLLMHLAIVELKHTLAMNTRNHLIGHFGHTLIK